MSNRNVPLITLLILLAFSTAHAAPARLEVLPGVDDTGHATALWQQMIRARLPAAAFEGVRDLEKPLTATERAWSDLIHARAGRWEAEIPVLARIIRPLDAPAARIVLGNRGGDDAFTHDPHTIGFDLERLHAIYGDATDPANTARIDRFFRHEYTHLLQKAWLAEHPVPLDSPLDRALAEAWAEGMGNFHSLSDSWRTRNGLPAEKALVALESLEPRFVARLAAIACASPERAQRLTADLSRGRFDRKWGALPVALWLEREPGEPEAVLREFLLAGPAGVWALAERHAAPASRAALSEARSAYAICRRE